MQKEAEVVRGVGKVAGEGFAFDKVFGFEGLTVGGEDVLGLLPGCAGAAAQLIERGWDGALIE